MRQKKLLQLEWESTVTCFSCFCLSFPPIFSRALRGTNSSKLKMDTPHPVLKGKLCSAIEMHVLVVGFF